MKFCSRVLLAAALLVFGYGFYGLLGSSESPGLELSPETYEPDSPLPALRGHTVRVTARNSSSRPVRVLNLVVC